MRTSFRRPAAAAATLLAVATLTVAMAGPATAGCPYESDWEVYAKRNVWMLTSTYSSWLSGPGTISYSTSSTASRGTTKSASISVSAQAIIYKAEAKFGMDWSSSTSKSQTWTYSIPVPSGQTARAGVYKLGSRFSVRRYTIGGNCTVSYGPTYYQFSPFGSNDNSKYCIGKDPQPGTQFVYTTGCGH
jgi:hypothetical protein